MQVHAAGPFDPRALFLPARASAAADRPWIPSGTPGKSAQLLRVFADDNGFVELMRMDPGVAMPLHRHVGTVHAYNLAGTRVLCTGEVIGPGDYVYEPAGTVDAWTVIGDTPLLVLAIVTGDVEFLAADGTVCARANAATQRAEYERHCRALRLPVADLADS